MQENQLVTRTDQYNVPFAKLRIKEGFNVREDYGNIDELAASIAENGVITPLRGWKEKEGDTEVYYIHDGHRRYTACKQLYEKGMTDLKVPFSLLNKKISNDETKTLEMLITAEGKPLTALEQSVAIERLIKIHKSTPAMIAKKWGKSSTYVSRLQFLIGAEQQLKALIKAGIISATLAMDYLAKGEGHVLIEKYNSGKYSGESLEQEAQEEKLVLTESAEEKPKRITKKDLQQVNSWKYFKKYSKEYSPELVIVPEKKLFYDFMQQILNNELTEEQIANFFENETV